MRSLSLLLVVLLTFPTIALAQEGDTKAKVVDDFREQWYSQYFMAMAEPLLADSPNEVYRFVWLRTFHNPIAVRITCDPRGCDLIAKRLDGSGGYEPGKIVEWKERRLSKQEVSNIRRLLSKAQFWKPQPSDERIGLDGAQWILEGKREDSYHMWDVWSPERVGVYGDFRKLCLELVRLSRLMVRSKEIY